MENTENKSAATKYCKHCGKEISENAVVCPHCGCQVEEIKQESQPNIVINNSNNNVNENINAMNIIGRKPINKSVSLMLCIFLGYFGAHKFYEGKTGMGILYLFTFGLCGFGWLADIFIIAAKPNPYYV